MKISDVPHIFCKDRVLCLTWIVMDKHEHGSILHYIVIPTLHHSLLTAADAVLKCRVVTRGRNWIGDIIISCSSSLNLDARGCSQMTSAFFGVSDPPWCLCQPIISFWPAPWCFKLTTSALNQKWSSLDDHWKCQSTIHWPQKGSSWA